MAAASMLELLLNATDTLSHVAAWRVVLVIPPHAVSGML
jgi:hypothetical protein